MLQLFVFLFFNCLFFFGTQAGVCGVTAAANTHSYTLSGSDILLVSNGCPAYNWTGQNTPFTANVQAYSFIIPGAPQVSTTPTVYLGVFRDKARTIVNPTPARGIVGFTVDGVALFGNADNNNQDAYLSNINIKDACFGFPDGGGFYHYVTEPNPNNLSMCSGYFENAAGKHSGLIGIMWDGIPIFGVFGSGGVIPTNLDECNGHVDADYPFYHYHAQNGLNYPYLINCLKGCLKAGAPAILSATGGVCTPAATQYNYASVLSLLQVSGTSQSGSVTASQTGTQSTSGSQTQTGTGSMTPNSLSQTQTGTSSVTPSTTMTLSATQTQTQTPSSSPTGTPRSTVSASGRTNGITYSGGSARCSSRKYVSMCQAAGGTFSCSNPSSGTAVRVCSAANGFLSSWSVTVRNCRAKVDGWCRALGGTPTCSNNRSTCRK